MNPIRISYIVMVITLVGVAWLDLAAPLITVLFSVFALQKFRFGRSKLVALMLYIVAVLAITYGFVFFLEQAVVAFPNIARTTVPAVIDYAKKHNIELPFTDMDSLKTVTIETVMRKFNDLTNLAKGTGRVLAQILIGMVVAVSLFFNARVVLEESRGGPHLYMAVADEIALRFRIFYKSFKVVMGAQIVISAINTALTAIFILIAGLPYASLVIALTFLCGLLPILGNLISNTIIAGVAFTVSPKMAVAALVFLVVLHKLEYFLNSKIIGDRIKNPVWLTLLGLIIGERLMGIPGMILAPVVFHWVKIEASKFMPEQAAPPAAMPPANAA